jgi:DNA-binding transcriptional ArsR family regulator
MYSLAYLWPTRKPLMKRTEPTPPPPAPAWTFLTNHAHVLLSVAKDPAARVRDLAAAVGITERAVQRILAELEEAGYLTREREGRRNCYEVCGDLPLRHPVEQHRRVAELLALAQDLPPRAARTAAKAAPVTARARR